MLVYIVPHYALDDEIRAYLARNFAHLRVFSAPERRFKQCVVIGTRCRPGYASKAALQMLVDAQASEEGAPMLPDSWELEPYAVPPAQPDQDQVFHAVRIDEEQLQGRACALPDKSALGRAEPALHPALRRMSTTPCAT